MNSYALLIDGIFKEIRQLSEKPLDIPHKNVTWHEVVHEFGNSEFTGLENNVWVIRTIDPSTLPPPVPKYITSRQLRLFLLQQNMLDSVEIIIESESREVQIQWEYATQFYRDDPLLNDLASRLQIEQEALDQFFIAAAAL